MELNWCYYTLFVLFFYSLLESFDSISLKELNKRIAHFKDKKYVFELKNDSS